MKDIYAMLRDEFPGNRHGDNPELQKPRKKRKKRILPRGVYPSKNNFMAMFMVDGNNVYVGSYKTPEEAHEAYLKAKADAEVKDAGDKVIKKYAQALTNLADR